MKQGKLPDYDAYIVLFQSYISVFYATCKKQKIAAGVRSALFTRLARWYDKVEKTEFKSFNTIARCIQNHYISTLNYFNNRNTNASAESFKAKIKSFRAQYRGVRNIPFFLFLD